MKELVLTAKAFADPSRVRILRALRERELCVCELCDALAATQSTLSTHLQVIRGAGLVSARKQGKWMYYAIAPDAKRLVDSWFRFFSGSLKKLRCCGGTQKSSGNGCPCATTAAAVSVLAAQKEAAETYETV